MILKINSKKNIEKLKKDAEKFGIPLTSLEDDLIIFYYNQIPLKEIPHLLTDLIKCGVQILDLLSSDDSKKHQEQHGYYTYHCTRNEPRRSKAQLYLMDSMFK